MAIDRLSQVLAAALENPDDARVLYESLVFRHDQGPVRHTVVAGRKLR